MARSRRSLASPERVVAILDRAGESRFAPTRSPIALPTWRAAVGARIAERASPLSLTDGVLWLQVPSSVWAHELSLLSDEVCQSLRSRGVEVRELRFRVGALPTVERPAERRASRAVPVVSRAVPHELVGVLAAVADPELRAIIEGALTANLAWQVATQPAPPGPVSEAQRAARAPRSAAEGSAPRAPASPPSREGGPGKRGDVRGRSR
jgi:hypothetical protein